MKCRPPLKCKRPQTREGENIENNSQIDFWLKTNKKKKQKIKKFEKNKIKYHSKWLRVVFISLELPAGRFLFDLNGLCAFATSFMDIASAAWRSGLIIYRCRRWICGIRDLGSSIFNLAGCWMPPD